MIAKRLGPVTGAMAVLLLLFCGAPALTQAQDTGQPTEDTSKPEKPEKNERTAKKNAERAPERAAAAGLPAVLTPGPSDFATLDTYDGIGGKDDAPDPNGPYTFLAEDLSQTQPKFDVRDAQGRHWRIKLGPESQPETAASRLVWAAGYFADADYYLPQVTVNGLPRLKRGEKFVKGDAVYGARLKLMPKKQKDIGYWSWKDNPFSNTSVLNGLRVMMALLNNWDLVTRNNKIYETDGQRRFVISDLGASFGRSGHEGVRSKGNLRDYEESKFIVSMTPETVDFYDHSRPLPVLALAPHYYPDLVHGEQVVHDIPRADAKSIGQRLSQLSDDQIRDCFRAAGYSSEEVNAYANVVRQRIRDLTAL